MTVVWSLISELQDSNKIELLEACYAPEQTCHVKNLSYTLSWCSYVYKMLCTTYLVCVCEEHVIHIGLWNEFVKISVG